MSRTEIFIYAVLGATMDFVVGLSRLHWVIAGHLVNPDSYMRLVRIQDSLDRHTLMDGVLRDASGAGTVLHWSHLLDGLLVILAAPLYPSLGWHRALWWAAAALGPLSMGLLGTALAWAVRPLAARGWLWLAPVAVPISAQLATYGAPGSATHHVLIVAAVTMVAGWCGRAQTRGAIAGPMAGAWAAVALWLSPESIVFSAMGLGLVGVKCLTHRSESVNGDVLRGAARTFALLTAIALMLDPPQAGFFAPMIDRLSATYLLVAMLLWIMVEAVMWINHRPVSPWLRALCSVGMALVALATWAALAGSLRNGFGSITDVGDGRVFFREIDEMQPIVDLASMVPLLFTGILALLGVMLQVLRCRTRAWWYAAACASVTIAVAVMHRRFAIYPNALGAAALPVAMTTAISTFQKLPARIAAGLATAIVFDLGLRVQGTPAPGRFLGQFRGCDVMKASSMLGPYAGAVVLAPVGDNPELLYRTGILTVGSLYHRNVAAYLRLREAWRSAPSNDIPKVVQATNAAFVLFCPRPGRLGMVDDLPPNTLYDQLNSGNTPTWLIPIAEEVSSGFTLYHVVVGPHSG